MASIGVEPIRPFGHRILSPARLPIPPRGRRFDYTSGWGGGEVWRGGSAVALVGLVDPGEVLFGARRGKGEVVGSSQDPREDQDQDELRYGYLHGDLMERKGVGGGPGIPQAR